jgi:hypothetical protein
LGLHIENAAIDSFDILNGLGSSEIFLNNGALLISLLDDFQPSSVDAFTVLAELQSVIGEFGNTLANRVHFDLGSFAIEYRTGSVVLSDFQAIPEPSSLSLLIMFGLVSSLNRRRRI